MAVTVRAGSAVVSAGTSGTGAQSITPTLPTGTVSGDRVFIFTDGTNTATISDVNWTQLIPANTLLGGGTTGAATGTRDCNVWYRDYDGVWTMPTVTQASQSTPSIAGCAVSVTPGSGETFNTPTFVTGSMTTAATAMSVASSTTMAWTTGGVALLLDAFPSTTTTASGAVTATGVTFGTVTNTVVSGGTISGNDAAVAVWTAPVSTGAAAATTTHTATLGTARTAGVVFVQQTSSAAASVTEQIIPPPSRARFRVSTF